MDDGGTEETHSSEGEEDLIELGDAGDGDGGLGTAFLGVHVHPPTAFLRQGCEDQEMLEEMLEEKRIRQAERESEAAAAAAAAHVADEIGGTSEVTVTETGARRPRRPSPPPRGIIEPRSFERKLTSCRPRGRERRRCIDVGMI